MKEHRFDNIKKVEKKKLSRELSAISKDDYKNVSYCESITGTNILVVTESILKEIRLFFNKF